MKSETHSHLDVQKESDNKQGDSAIIGGVIGAGKTTLEIRLKIQDYLL